MLKSLSLPLLLATALNAAASPAAHAHPHEFVTLAMEAIFNGKGEITGMRYNWEFDELFTAFAVEGQDNNKNGKAEAKELLALGNEILGNIHEINYFTKFDARYPAPALKPAALVDAKLAKRQFSMTFSVAFKEPYSLKSGAFSYAIYDDEFYIAMMHADAEKALKLSNAPKGCKWNLREPDPDEDVTAFASSLGRNESGGSDLGAEFAEWVSITCK